ncbi:hypothetical protein QBC38DRAFT_449713 [Podospora fimiseda]|uniref:Uncharacterized protein n=1 Tax=Podospora fimiseda TaxID=252190 RepID=A0AAN7BGD2_9PEZI|nr:hypothetical protein QBC38DRAFT_449713 [Podospora fimiseda]
MPIGLAMALQWSWQLIYHSDQFQAFHSLPSPGTGPLGPLGLQGLQGPINFCVPAADNGNTVPDANDGLTVGQPARLAVGMTAVVVAFIGFGFLLFMRNRRVGDKEKSAAERYNISPPVPPQSPYMHENASSTYEGTHGSSGDLKAFKYEKLVPRVQPRQMV